jgi:adenine-specific DNA methylase
MARFASKSAPSIEKLRGGYYTPPPLGTFLARWVAAAGPKLLEPSCGDGALLRCLANLGFSGSEVLGAEIDPTEAKTARAALPGATVVEGDFFEWLATSGGKESFNGVLGNPPFIRFQHWQDPERGRALDLMRSVGLRPNRLTNAWVPFVVASSEALADDGRLGLVLPAELMQVGYASELRGYLVDRFSQLTVVTFRKLVFEGILQEVVLLLGLKGAGPAEMRVLEVDDATALPADPFEISSVQRAPALLHDQEKWTKYFLDPGEIENLRRIRLRAGQSTFSDFGEVDVGIVTGRNRFFVLTPSKAAELELVDHVVPLISRSAHLSGVSLTEADAAALTETDAQCLLLKLAKDAVPDQALAGYISAGEAEGVHEGYKCSIREPWWAVPSAWVPGAFMLRQIYEFPKVVANKTGATSTDTIHRVRLKPGVDGERLAAASINSLTFAFSEVMGRSYGGGVLELEPREAEALPFPDPQALRRSDVTKIDSLIRSGDVRAALDIADERLLRQALGLSPKAIQDLRSVWVTLRERRLRRGGRSEAKRRAA